ncbi:hypothetical protein HBI56_158590 [Parastagonospora nodorum]|nr:hypothetical protein HBI10_183620 [Parastagonospora nodorum]KAH4014066.1 hypothetical protein HBI13_175720 [Parastagonospora nodorum]KAH4021925.1 hypothetical protein HBI09_173900 [Parastagonospora nodorum]KAH4045371.1 hypothetical protein HBH49_203140 [Parastagonospora nodorum]KAH4073751.1 hypothetical protein HBH50_037810 [Parastagonospora nodorum]
MADKLKNIAKQGWHPERDRAASSDGGGGRLGQVKGMLGRGGGSSSHVEAAKSHQSTPLSQLADPSSFAPPPKRLDYGASPVASRATPASTTAPAGSARQRLQEREEAQRRAEEEANRPPPGPYRPDTTGLDTSHLPKPPAFRPGAASPAAGSGSKPKPSLPPRLPPRQTENPNEYTPPPPPTYTEATQETPSARGVLNQGALNRLGQAGVSVPGFGVGRTASPPVPPRQTNSPPVPPRQNSASAVPTSAAPPAATTGRGSQLGELQSRFSKMSAGGSTSTAPTTGTSWADKQAALRTASGLRDDPSKVSTTDMKNAASTANNFQQRHGAQVASGFKAANGLNQKYGIAGRVNNFASDNTASSPQSPTTAGPGAAGKKLAPPPPPKKKELAGSSSEPPPIPLSSKPKF